MKQALYQKYRPKDFSAAIGQEKIVQTLKNALKSGRTGHAYLFAGQRGTGKTTYARILAQSLNCQKPKDGNGPCFDCQFCQAAGKGQAIDIIEIDAASNRGIDEIRDLREKIRFAPTLGKYKVYIIDEVHMLTKEAFNALLKTLEEPPPHVVFIMATTEAHKLPATILSRVQRFDFGRIPIADITKNLRLIADKEKIEIDDEALLIIAGKADGSHRDAISLLEQIKSYATKISAKEVGEVLGLVGNDLIYRLLGSMVEADLKQALVQIESYYEGGFDLSQLALSLVETIRKAMLLKSGVIEKSDLTKEEAEGIAKLEKLSADRLIVGIEQLSSAGRETKISSIQSLPLELAVSRIVKAWDMNDSPTKLQIDQRKHKSTNDTNSHQPTSRESKPTPEVNSDINNKTMKQSDNETDATLDDRTWKEILDRIKLQNHTLQALLRDIKPLGIVEGRLKLCAKFKFHKDKVSEIGNRQLVEKIITEVTGQKLPIFCELADETAGKRKGLKEDELLQVAEEVFS